MAVVAFASWFAWKSLANPPKEPQRPVKVVVEKGMTATEIGEMLEEKKVIKSAFVFKYYVRKQAVAGDFKPGEYDMKTQMEYDAVIKKLVAGPPIKYVDITLPEGWTAKQMAGRVSAVTKVNEDEYLNLVNQGNVAVEYPFLKGNGAPTPSLEGYLYPQTYKVQQDITAPQFLNVQLTEFNKATSSLNWPNAQALGQTPYQIIVIASLIERETIADDERAIVASVIYNRLKIGMPLQIDATVQYALPEWKDRLTYDDLKVDSPYNTYQNKGLPPGPICNPSRESIEAALNPVTSEFLYYVLAPDNSGHHVFAATYEEFLRAKQQYQASRQ